MAVQDHYLGNPLLKRANTIHNFTEDQINEIILCQDDPIYFAQKYIQIVTLDHGLQPIVLYPFQEKMLRRFHHHRFNICKLPRQAGKSTIVVTYLLHYALFNANSNIAILANKASTAKDLLDRLQTAYENLPKWMQQGVLIWNKASLELENGSKIIAASTSASAVRGGSYNIIFLDEFAFVPNHIADEFFSSVYPTISSGHSTKVIIVSCVVDDTFILSDKGIFEMSDYIQYGQPENPKIGYNVPDYKVYGYNQLNDGNILVNSGFAETKIIRTPSSYVECSLEHPWFVCDNGIYKWKKTYELTGDEYVAIQYGHNVWDNNDKIPQNILPKRKSNLINYNLTEITSDLAYFMGLYISEGSSFKNKSGTFTGISITCGDDISDCLNSLGLNYSCSDGLHYNISSTYLCDILISLGFDLSRTAKEKIIPKRLFRMSSTNIISMIQGIMDGDGSSQKNKGVISLVSTSKRLIEQVRILLNNFGILSIYSEYTVKPTKKVKVYSYQYRLELNQRMSKKYYETIGFRFNRKQLNEVYLPKTFSRDRCDIIPFSKTILKNLKNKDVIKTGIFKGNYHKNKHFNRNTLLQYKNDLLKINHLQINELLEYVSENIKWEPITSLTKSQNKVYDFSLNKTGDKWCHSVLFNNIVGSNTPKGMNHFYKKWHDAERDLNEYVPTEVHWSEVPGRDENWKKQTIANTSPQQFQQEFECEFLGSANTLISGIKLKSLVYTEPIISNAGLDIYEGVEENHDYVITVDVARGVEQDYSTFLVIDITTYPHKVVAKYRNNDIKPILFPNIIVDTAKNYNKAFILCEVNDIGDQVANIIHYDLEYSNVLMCAMQGRAGQALGQGFSGKKCQLGVKMSKKVKQVGCLNLKTFVEDNKIVFHDYDLISELTTFVQKNNTFCAEEGSNDDLAMCLVIYAWMVTQDYFKELTDQDIRKKIYDERKNEIEQDMSPFGFIIDGTEETTFVDKSGDRWYLDEYGDKSHEYEYMWNNY